MGSTDTKPFCKLAYQLISETNAISSISSSHHNLTKLIKKGKNEVIVKYLVYLIESGCHFNWIRKMSAVPLSSSFFTISDMEDLSAMVSGSFARCIKE
jgi:hypothetical protein